MLQSVISSKILEKNFKFFSCCEVTISPHDSSLETSAGGLTLHVFRTCYPRPQDKLVSGIVTTPPLDYFHFMIFIHFTADVPFFILSGQLCSYNFVKCTVCSILESYLEAATNDHTLLRSLQHWISVLPFKLIKPIINIG